MAHWYAFKAQCDAGFGQFITILQWVAWRRGLYFEKVDKNYTSQICPNCGTHTGKKQLAKCCRSPATSAIAKRRDEYG
jgi:putative transposase